MKKLTKKQILKMVREYAKNDFENGLTCPDDFRARELYEYYNRYTPKFDFSNVNDDEIIDEYKYTIESVQ